MLTGGEHGTPIIICKICQTISDTEDTPGACKTGTIISIKLSKKGELGNCNNWRGITLLSLTGKLCSRIILKRVSAAIGINRPSVTSRVQKRQVLHRPHVYVTADFGTEHRVE